MNKEIIHLIAEETGINSGPVSAIVNLNEEGATIPFISRYRKEQTGNLDEVAIEQVVTKLKQYQQLSERKHSIIQAIKEQGLLTIELESKISNCWDKNKLEDIYLPFKRKKTTLAAKAREAGLEPLAKELMKQGKKHVDELIHDFAGNIELSKEEAITGAQHIIAEWVSEHQEAREMLRKQFATYALVSSKVVSSKKEEAEKYQDYFNFEEPVKKIPSHRVLALLRAEKEGFLKVHAAPDQAKALERLKRFFVINHSSSSELVKAAVEDAYKRLLLPSLENELKKKLKTQADEVAIDIFAKNLKPLLLAPPIGGKRTLAIDPGFRTGCKVVCLDGQGNLLHNETIYPHQPKNDFKGAANKINGLVGAYKIEAIAIGNGTAGRETEAFIKRMRFEKEVAVYVVNESGASVYSASAIAREEFPQYDVTVRGAVSIGRRLMDPLAELVKIEPKSIGVGQYQHDVDQKRLQERLNQVVENCVSAVGINANTASKHVLKYVAGVGEKLAENIVNYRAKHGLFKSRKELLKVPKMGNKTFEQCAGFIRIPSGKNPLDNTSIHPERYQLVEDIAKKQGKKVAEIIGQPLEVDVLKNSFPSIGIYTLQDILNELKKPGVDPRKKASAFAFDSTIQTMEDLREGMVLPGLVSNITQFGAFVNIGVKQDGLVHISEMADRFVSDPHEVLTLNEAVKVKVISIDLARKRIGLSMKQAN